MASRTGYAWSARAAATSARMNSAGFGWLGFARVTAEDQNLGVVTGTTGYDIADASVTVFTHTNRMILVQAHATVTCTGTTEAARCSLQIIEGGTTIGQSAEMTVSTLEHLTDGTQ